MPVIRTLVLLFSHLVIVAYPRHCSHNLIQSWTITLLAGSITSCVSFVGELTALTIDDLTLPPKPSIDLEIGYADPAREQMHKEMQEHAL